jgi:hypothetical protein
MNKLLVFWGGPSLALPLLLLLILMRSNPFQVPSLLEFVLLNLRSRILAVMLNKSWKKFLQLLEILFVTNLPPFSSLFPLFVP